MKSIILFILVLACIKVSAQNTFYNNTSYPIPDGNVNGVYSDIVVSAIPPTATLSQLTINITHTWVSDLDIFIVDPLNNEHLLCSEVGGSGDNFTNTTFSINASTSITSGAPPFTGSFIPQQSLPTGLNPNGTWRLHVIDYTSSDAGSIVNWNITFVPPTCPMVGFHENNTSPTTIPSSVDCNTADLYFYANDSSVAGGPIYPTLFFQFHSHDNAALNSITIYEDGASIYTQGPLDVNTVLTVYATGAFMSPTSDYTIQVCNTGGTAPMEWVVYDGNGYTHASGITPTGCTTYGPWSPQGQGTWSISPSTAGFGTSDWGVCLFSPSTAGPGTYQITYNWNNQGSGAYLCTGSQSQSITVNNPWNAAWTSPGTICESNGSINLNNYITGNTGGTWSGSGVSGNTFNPSGLSGAVNVTYTVGSASNCQAIQTNAITVTPLATAEAGNNASICSGSTHTISGASIGGSAPTIFWSTSGDGSFSSTSVASPTYTPGANDIAAGSVTLTITGSGSCASAADFMTLTITGLDDASFSYASGTFCQTGSNPSPTSVTLGGSYSSTPAGLSINSSTGEINLTASTTGITYTVTYTTGGSCSNGSSVTVLVTSGFDASFSYNGPYCQSETNPSPSFTTGSAGVFSASPAGLTFMNTSTGVIDLNTSLPGIYAVTNTIEASGGCAQAQSSASVTIEAAPIVTASPDQNICGDTTANITASMGGAATFLTWSSLGNGSFSGPATSAVYTPGTNDITNGTAVLIVTTNDPDGVCNAATDTVVLTIFQPAVINAGTDATICEGWQHSLTANTSGSTTSYTWTTSGNGSFDDVHSPTPVYTPSPQDISAGNVILTITTNDPAGPCNASANQMILLINAAPVVYAGVDAAICEGASFTISSSSMSGSATGVNWVSGGTGSFNNPNTLHPMYTPSVADITAGVVQLIITSDDPAGPCTFTRDTMVLTINPAPDIDSVITTQVTSCATPNATIDIYANGTNPLQYSINNGANFSSAINYSGLDIGVYVIIVRDGNNCQTSMPTTITSLTEPVIDSIVVSNANCFGSTDGQITIYSGDAVLYSINNGQQLFPNNTFTGLGSGTYDIFIEDAGSCHADTLITLTEPAAITGTLTQTNISCFGGTNGTATMNASGGTGTFSYIWSTTPPQTIQTATGLVSDNYSVTVSDQNGCTYVSNVFLSQPLPVSIDSIFSSPVLCPGGSDGSAWVDVSGGTLPYSFIWSTSPVTNDSIAVNLTAGTYYVTVSDNNNCIVSDSVIITSSDVDIAVSLTVTPASCYGFADGSIMAVGNGGTSPYNFAWSNGQADSVAVNLIAGLYEVTVSDANGCSDTASAIVLQPVSMIAAHDSTPASCIGNNDGIASVIASNGTAPYSYLWSNGATNATASGLIAGTYMVTITDANSCTKTETIIVETIDKTCLDIPTAFSPNGDGKNDKWILKHIDLYPKAKVEIYNRWGLMIFQSEKYFTEPWDGTYNGNEVTTGSYVYILNLNDGSEPQTGTVTVIR